MTTPAQDSTDLEAVEKPERSRAFAVLAPLGFLAMGYGLFGLLKNAALTTPMVTLPRLGGAVLLNDLLLIPLLLGVGALTTLLPVRLRPPIRAALIVTGVVLVLALWATEGQRRSVQPGNTHILPNNYVVSALLILGPVWALAAAVSVWSLLTGSRSAKQNQ